MRSAIGQYFRDLVISKKIFLVLVCLTLLVTGVACVGLFMLSRAELDRSLSQRLEHLAITASLLVDGDDLDAVRTESDLHGAAWEAIAKRLVQVREKNGLRNVYAMRRGHRAGYAEFVVDPAKNDAAPIGKEYDLGVAPAMAIGFERPAVDAEIVHDEYDDTLSGYAPIERRDGSVAGIVGVDMDASEVLAARRKFAALTAGLAVLFLLVSVVASALFSRVLTGPILEMTRHVQAVSEGDLERRMTVRGKDEIGQLSAGLNRMIETLNRYLPVRVVAKILGGTSSLSLGGVRAPTTVFFSDVADFTSISEKLAPEEVVHLMNQYLSAMTDVIEKTGGTVDKYIGDAIMAFWGAPEPQVDHASRACEAALLQLEALTLLYEDWAKEGKPGLRIRIGLNAGEVVVGNMGSSRRFNYTVMGDVVNLASRLEAANKNYGTTTLIGETVVKEAGDAFEFRRLDRLRVKGKTKAVEVYELLARKGKAAAKTLDARDAFERALAAYFARDWDSAESALDCAASLRPDDAAVGTYRKRIVELRANPPPAGWDGSYEMRSK
jgi:class 3 adenylate cyclase